MYQPFIRTRYKNLRPFGEYGKQYNLITRMVEAVNGVIKPLDDLTQQALTDIDHWLLWQLPYKMSLEIIPDPQNLHRNKKPMAVELKAEGLPAFAHYSTTFFQNPPSYLRRADCKLWSRFYEADNALKRRQSSAFTALQPELAELLKGHPLELPLILQGSDPARIGVAMLHFELTALLTFALTYYEVASLGTLMRQI